MNNRTKEFLDELSILLNDFHAVSLRVNNDHDICLTFEDQSEIRFDRFAIDRFYGIRSSEFESEYKSPCITNIQRG